MAVTVSITNIVAEDSDDDSAKLIVNGMDANSAIMSLAGVDPDSIGILMCWEDVRAFAKLLLMAADQYDPRSK